MKIVRRSESAVLTTATTGIASLSLREVGGRTLHSALGLLDGRESAEEICERLRMNDSRQRERLIMIKNASMIIIDEYSMLSRYVIEKVRYTFAIFILREVLQGSHFVI